MKIVSDAAWSPPWEVENWLQELPILADHAEDGGRHEESEAMRWLIREERIPLRDQTNTKDLGLVVTFSWFVEGLLEGKEPEDLPAKVLYRMKQGVNVNYSVHVNADSEWRSYHTEGEAWVAAINTVATILRSKEW